MSKSVDSEIIKEETVEAATFEGTAETPAVAPPVLEAIAASTAQTFVESSTGQPATPTSGSGVVESVKAGASAAQEAVANLWPAVGKNLRGMVYNGFYYVSFGVTFSALTVASLVPTDNVMVKALADGAEAANEAFHKQHDRTVSSESGSVLSPDLGEGMVAA